MQISWNDEHYMTFQIIPKINDVILIHYILSKAP